MIFWLLNDDIESCLDFRADSVILTVEDLKDLMTNQVFGWEFCVVQQENFHSQQDYEQANF